MLTDIALIILLALVGNLVFDKLGLPGILGMIAAGVTLGPYGLDQIEPELLGLLRSDRVAWRIRTLSLYSPPDSLFGPFCRRQFCEHQL